MNKKYIRSLKLIDSLGIVRFGIADGGVEATRDVPSDRENPHEYLTRVHTTLLSSPNGLILRMSVPIVISCPMIKDLPDVAAGQGKAALIIVEVDILKTAATFLQHVSSPFSLSHRLVMRDVPYVSLSLIPKHGPYLASDQPRSCLRALYFAEHRGGSAVEFYKTYHHRLFEGFVPHVHMRHSIVYNLALAGQFRPFLDHLEAITAHLLGRDVHLAAIGALEAHDFAFSQAVQEAFYNFTD